MNIIPKYSDYGSHKEPFQYELRLDELVDTYMDITATIGTQSDYFPMSRMLGTNYKSFDMSQTLFDSASLGNNTVAISARNGNNTYTTSFTFTKAENTTPSILTNKIGNVDKPFTTIYQVYDEDGDDVDVEVKLDGTTIDTIYDAPQHTDISLTLTSEQFNALSFAPHHIIFLHDLTQDILNGLSSGEHTLTVKATTESGFSNTSSSTFDVVSNPSIAVESDFGNRSSAFDIPITLFGINDNATFIGEVDGQAFYQLNFAVDGNYTVHITDNLLLGLGGGLHQIEFSLTDMKGKTASGLTQFTKLATVPIVSVPSNVGDKKASFAIPYSIKNAQSEHPALVAYLDAVTDIIYQNDDASTTTSFTVDLTDVDDGVHSVIVAVTNTAGTTTKNVAFNKVSDDKTYTGLKLGYSDDTWDGTVLENRIYEETDVTYAGHTYKSYEDKTPYDTEGEVVTGGLLAAMSRGVQNAGASNLVKNSDGSYTETSANGISNITPTENGYVEVFTDKEGNILTKNVYFNMDGSVAESTTFERA